MRYLFVDLLWNTPKRPEMEREIYGFSCQLGWPWEPDIKTFGRYLRVEHPENITKQTEAADEQQSDDAPAGVDACPCGRCFYADIFTV